MGHVILFEISKTTTLVLKEVFYWSGVHGVLRSPVTGCVNWDGFGLLKTVKWTCGFFPHNLCDTAGSFHILFMFISEHTLLDFQILKFLLYLTLEKTCSPFSLETFAISNLEILTISLSSGSTKGICQVVCLFCLVFLVDARDQIEKC